MSETVTKDETEIDTKDLSHVDSTFLTVKSETGGGMPSSIKHRKSDKKSKNNKNKEGLDNGSSCCTNEGCSIF